MDCLRCNPVSIPPKDHFPQLHDARHQLNIALLNIQSLKTEIMFLQEPYVGETDVIYMLD